MPDLTQLLAAMNRRLAGEWQAVHTYQHYAATVTGPLRTSLAELFSGEAGEEMGHVTYLQQRIAGLGGTPTTEALPVPAATGPQEMLTALQAAERTAAGEYAELARLASEAGDGGLSNRLEELQHAEEMHAEEIGMLLADSGNTRGGITDLARSETGRITQGVDGKGSAREWLRRKGIAAAVTGQPWAILPEALSAVLDATERGDAPKGVAAREGRPLDNTEDVTVRDGIAILPVRGGVSHHPDRSMWSWLFGGGGACVEDLAKDLRQCLDDPQVRGVLLDVDSPGGEIGGVGELAWMIRGGCDEKPIWAYVSDMGASAAYWLASATRHITCAPTARLGSIGVIMTVTDSSEAAKRYGYQRHQIISSQSPKKRADPSTEAGRSQLQEMIDDIGAEFVRDVARYRGVSEETVLEEFGAGALLVGQRAVDAGLADELGTFEGTLKALAEECENRRAWPGLRGPMGQEGKAPMTIKDMVKNILAHAGINWDAEAPAGQASEPPAAPPAPAEDPEKVALQKALAEEREQRLTAEAERFVADLVAHARAVPAERAGLVAEYVQAARDDAAMPLASGSRVQALIARCQARPQHLLTKELLQDGAEKLAGATKLENRQETPKPGEPQPMTAEEEEKLLSYTTAGRAVLAERRAGKAGK